MLTLPWPFIPGLSHVVKRKDLDICSLLGYYAAYIANSLSTFRGQPIGLSSGGKNSRRKPEIMQGTWFSSSHVYCGWNSIVQIQMQMQRLSV
jgi:hypothetical protein